MKSLNRAQREILNILKKEAKINEFKVVINDYSIPLTNHHDTENRLSLF